MKRMTEKEMQKDRRRRSIEKIYLERERVLASQLEA